MPETVLKFHDAADGLPAMHQVEAGIDLLQWHRVGYQVVYVDLALHVPVHDLWHVRPAPGAAEGATLPDPPRDELKRARGDLLPRPGHPDDYRDAPALVGALESLAHHIDVAYALEAVVGTAIGQVDEIRHQVLLDLTGVHEMGHPELLRQGLASWVDVHANYLVSPDHAGALDYV